MTVPEKIQAEVARLRATIAETTALLPNARVSWVFYEAAIAEAERAVRQQDTAAMVRILPELEEME